MLVPFVSMAIGIVGFIVGFATWAHDSAANGTVEQNLLQLSGALTVVVALPCAAAWSRAMSNARINTLAVVAQFVVCLFATWTVVQFSFVTGAWFAMAALLVPYAFLLVSVATAATWVSVAGTPPHRSGNVITPALWTVIGAGLGGFFGLEALSYLSPLALIPVGIGVWLYRRTRQHREGRHQADLAGYILGAGIVGTMFVLPLALTRSCSSSSGTGDCNASGCAWVDTSTGCGPNYWAILVAVLYAAVLITAVLLIARAARSRSRPPSISSSALEH